MLMKALTLYAARLCQSFGASGFGVLGLGFRVRCPGFRVSGFLIQVSLARGFYRGLTAVSLTGSPFLGVLGGKISMFRVYVRIV